MRILITGSNGFLGCALTKYLSELPNYQVIAAVRRKPALPTPNVLVRMVGDIGPDTQWHDALTDVEVVVHTAARAHVLNEHSTNPSAEFRRVNVYGALTLARQAGNAGVKRFIFISSIGVNGASTTNDPFTEKMMPNPHAVYASSKHEAELALADLCHELGLELTIIRPPLIYAAHAPGNFGLLLKLVRAGFPLPLALVKNQRSFIYLDNLVDFISCCILHPLAANETFVISDGEDISTPQLLKTLASEMNRSPLLLPIPIFLLRVGAKLLRREAMYQQLCGSLQVDISKSRGLLSWSAPISVKAALSTTAKQFITPPSR